MTESKTGRRAGESNGSAFGELPGHVLDSLLEGCQVIGPDFRYLYVNDAAAEHGRRPRAALLGRTMTECYPGIEQTALFAALRACLEDRQAGRMVNEFAFPDGSMGWFELRIEPVPEGVVVLSIDITERRRAEARVTQLDAMLRGIRNVNQLITREADPQRLIERACHLLVESRGLTSCCIVLTLAGVVTQTADSGDEARLVTVRQMLARGELPECLRKAAVDGDPVVRPHTGETCSGCPVNADDATDRDATAVPLSTPSRRYGAMLVSLPGGAVEASEEIDLLRELAADLALALENIERQAAAERAQVERDSLAKFPEENPNPVLRVAHDGTILYANPGAAVVLAHWGCSPGQRLPAEMLGPVAQAARTGARRDLQQAMGGAHYWLTLSPVAGQSYLNLYGIDVTARVQAEEALRASEIRFRATFEHAGVGIAHVAPDGRWLRVNQRLCEILGYTRDELHAVTFQSLTHADDVAADVAARAGLLAGGTPSYARDKRYLRKDGGIVWVHVRVAPVRDAAGDVEYFITVVEDVSARRAAADRIARLSLIYRTLSDANQAIVRVTDEQELLQRICNLAVGLGGLRLVWTGMHDAERNVLVPRAAAGELADTVREVVLPLATDGPAGQALACEAFRQGVTLVSNDYRADSERAYWHGQSATAGVASAVCLPLRKGGRVVGVLSLGATDRDYFDPEVVALVEELGLDVSLGLDQLEQSHRLAQTLAALRQSEERYRDLVENLDDVVFQVDPEGRFRYVSPAVRKYGYEPEDLVGRSFATVIHAEDLALARASLERVLNGGDGPSHYRALDTHGAVHEIRVSSRAVHEHGRVVGLTGVLMDVTEQLRTEEQLRVAQRLEAVGRLAGGVAHDFNNILAVIINYAGFAMDVVRAGEPLRDDLEEILKAARSAAALTRQLLAFSRKQVLKPERLSLNHAIKAMEAMVRRLMREDIELVLELAEDAGLVLVDRSQIEQVLMNLLVNARDAMPHGGKVTIRTSNTKMGQGAAGADALGPPQRYTVLSVSDTGAGMDAQTKARIFDPFFTTKGLGQGTGLGLATVHGVVEQSGGSIRVASEPGQGATFEILLPVAVAWEEPRRPAVATGRPAGKETILVVEDEEGVRNVAKRALGAAGYMVLVAANGAEALLACQQHQGALALLITDVVMPGMSGRELADRLTVMRPGLRVLFMSGYTDDALAHHGVLDPGVELLEKPFNVGELLRKVRELIDVERPSEPPAGS